ncbi:MAG TPA: hypothetical protein VJH03_13080 [Blastocatellia bacterium]|nr:hypothetical protein [Blastocatellia bacterium]
MSLKQWADNGWLRPHQTSPQEIADLLAIVERDLADAQSDISADWRFGIAYNATLKLCTILLHASGYRPEKALQHYRTIAALPLILGERWKDNADYLETCRRKRNIAEYDRVGVVTEQDASELASFCRELRQGVFDWLNSNRPELAPVLGS